MVLSHHHALLDADVPQQAVAKRIERRDVEVVAGDAAAQLVSELLVMLPQQRREEASAGHVPRAELSSLPATT